VVDDPFGFDRRHVLVGQEALGLLGSGLLGVGEVGGLAEPAVVDGDVLTLSLPYLGELALEDVHLVLSQEGVRQMVMKLLTCDGLSLGLEAHEGFILLEEITSCR